MSVRHKVFSVALAGIAAAAQSQAAVAQCQAGWEPSEDIEIISHATAASGTYRFGLAVIKAIESNDLLPEDVDIEIRTIQGARGSKARRYVALDNADNPYVLQVVTPSQINNPLLTQSPVNYKDFKGVAAVVISPMVMVVNADSPYHSVGDIVAAAEENPGELVLGGGAFGQVASLVGILFEESQGIDITYTPFEDQGILQLLGGHIDFILENPPQFINFVRAGKMRMLATNEKLGFAPEVPTFKEAGYDFQQLRQYRGFWVGDDVCDEAIAYYVDLFDKARKTDEFQDYVAKNSLAPIWITGSELDDMIKAEAAAYRKLGKQLGLIQPE